jgi:hypothetical protein
VHNIDARHHFKELDGHVWRRSRRRRGDVELAGIGFGESDQVGHRLRRERRVRFHDQRDAVDRRHRRNVVDKIVVEMFEQRGVDRVRRRGEEQRVTVRRRVHDRLGADIAAGAGPVLDHDRLTETIRQKLRGHARDNVDLAAGRKADDQMDGPRRI